MPEAVNIPDKLKDHFSCAAIWFLEKADVFNRNLTKKESAIVDLFEWLEKTVDAIPPALMHRTEELEASSPENFQKILEALIPYVGGKQIKPATAAEFVEKLNEFVRWYSVEPEAFSRPVPEAGGDCLGR